MAFSKRIIKQQAKKKYPKFPNKLQQQKYKTLLKKLTHRPRASILRAKQLKKLKLEEKLRAVTKFIKRNIGKCYKTVARRYFLKNHPISIT